jgi:N-acetylglutamate synthase-like GNAT family acetyltransferase
MSVQYRIRPLMPGDLEHLWQMEWDPLPRQISTFYLLCTIGHPRFCSVAVDSEGEIIGVLLATPDENAQWVYINHIRIEPRCRGAGIGQALVKHLESQARAAGFDRIWLLTSEDVEPFYQPMGYQRDASFMPPITRQLMQKHRQAALILSKCL